MLNLGNILKTLSTATTSYCRLFTWNPNYLHFIATHICHLQGLFNVQVPIEKLLLQYYIQPLYIIYQIFIINHHYGNFNDRYFSIIVK